MAIHPGPYDLDETRLVLGPTHEASSHAVTPTFYEDLGRDFRSFAGHVLISRHAFDEPWETWEIHPHGDEFVYLISGDVDFVLRVGGSDETLRVKESGSYVVVPKGTWHTARPHVPTTMLFVTPGQGTENRETPG